MSYFFKFFGKLCQMLACNCKYQFLSLLQNCVCSLAISRSCSAILWTKILTFKSNFTRKKNPDWKKKSTSYHFRHFSSGCPGSSGVTWRVEKSKNSASRPNVICLPTRKVKFWPVNMQNLSRYSDGFGSGSVATFQIQVGYVRVKIFVFLLGSDNMVLYFYGFIFVIMYLKFIVVLSYNHFDILGFIWVGIS